MQLKYINLTPELVGAVAEIAAFAPDPWYPQDFEDALADAHQWCCVALLNKTPVGFACYFSLSESVDLRLIAVAPSLRGRGVATGLLKHTLGVLAAQGKETCLLEVRCSNQAAIAFYEKSGFHRLALRKSLYSGPMEDGYLYSLSLSPSAAPPAL